MSSDLSLCQGSINQFDAILYINLAHRTDRKSSILSQLALAKANPHKIIRIDAVADLFNGHRGCAMSHIKALNYAIEKKYKNVLILEDDFIFTETLDVINTYIDHFLIA